MPMSPPLVTVNVTCFNHERFVVECLESVRAQTYPNVQLVVIDDCSTDGSVALIREWLEQTGTRCTLVLHEENQGICRTRNDILSRARGKYVTGLATDDTWFPDKIAVQVEQFERLPPSVALLYSDAYLMDEQGRPLPMTFFDRSRSYRSFDRQPEGDVFLQLLETNFIPAMSTMVRRECYEAVGPYDESLAYEDWDMWLRMARRYHFAFSPHIGARYRVHPAGLSNTLGARAWETDIAIFRKQLGHSKRADAIIWERLALTSFRLGTPERLAWASRSLRESRNPRSLFLYLLCLSRLPYRYAVLAKHALAGLGSTLRALYPGGTERPSTETSL